MKFIYTIQDLKKIVEDTIFPLTKTHSVLTFKGELGAGKTTLIKELLKACGVNQIITSPTFTYVNEYSNEHGKLFYHFDLYRMNSLEEFVAAGFDEYLFQPNSLSLIEWPQIIISLLNDRGVEKKVSFFEINYVQSDLSKREIIITL